MHTILVLEDDPYRYEVFKDALGRRSVLKWTDNALAAIEALEKEDFDIIFLDHDLGGLTFVSESDENTGSEVVRWLTKNFKAEEQPCIIIHSLNGPAAISMKSKLESVGYEYVQIIPFTKLVDQIDQPDFLQ